VIPLGLYIVAFGILFSLIALAFWMFYKSRNSDIEKEAWERAKTSTMARYRPDVRFGKEYYITERKAKLIYLLGGLIIAFIYIIIQMFTTWRTG
jgi:hypothetical protein